MKLTDKMLFMLMKLNLTDEMFFVLTKLLKLAVDRAVDKTADRTVCETVMIDRTVSLSESKSSQIECMM